MAKNRVLRSDTPISEAGEDKLQRVQLASQLAKRIIAYEGSQALAVGVSGLWGIRQNLVFEPDGE